MPRVNTSADQVVKAALGTLEDWLPVFIAEQERLEGRPQAELPMPASYMGAADRGTGRPEDGYPRVAVIALGLSGEPVRRAIGKYDLEFALAAGVFLRGNSREEVRSMLTSYVSAIRNCLLHKGLGDLEATMDFADESYDESPADKARSLGGGEVAFSVMVENAVVLGDPIFPEGPPDDPYEPIPDQPTIVVADVEVYPVPLNNRP